mmetsp:Transcript_62112/g.166282  ORF Transcript_62112/g.166282 Transcript_62112/m.166282 type:complete len:227 (-) Transcript_62112:113-793(-)
MGLSEIEANKQVESMAAFILNEAQAKSDAIRTKADEDFENEKMKIVENSKKKLRNEFENKKKKVATEVAINKSTAVNRARLRMIAERQEVIQRVSHEAREELSQRLNDQAWYKGLLVDLIVQGALQLLETQVMVRCREADASIVTSVLPQAQSKYAEFIKQQTGATTDVKFTYDHTVVVPDSALGGVILSCHGGRITCDNTLGARLQLVMENDKPSIRAQLFPHRR